ncbi:MAG TPA: hypothetical protein VI076_14655 [Actinopolymorphaceae bacterium]
MSGTETATALDTSPSRPAPSSARIAALAPTRRLLPPGWPLSALFLGFPVWWALGLATFVFPLMAVPMAAELISRRTVRIPRGLGVWALFLVWMLAGVAMLWADAPGAVPGGMGGGRLMVFAYRAAMYVAATIILLYVLNADERTLPTRRVTRLLAVMFVITTCGGLLGLIAPGFEFRSLLEIVLPGSLANNEFVNRMIHPAAADIQRVLGYEEARPIAPFAFANSWGANLSLYLPFFVLAWFGKDAGRRRFLAPLVLMAAMVPVVYSLNRGLWLALGFGVAYVALRFAFLGRVWAVQLIGAALLVGVVAFVATPLSDIVTQRLDSPHSNDRRTQLAVETVRAVAVGSPILGYGSTRDVQGSFASIAGGATPDCPACGVPPLGTQGHFWMVTFSQGLVGLALFLFFFARRFFVHWRDPSPLAITGCCVLMFFGLELLVYDTLGAPLVTVMIAIALMARAKANQQEGQP